MNASHRLVFWQVERDRLKLLIQQPDNERIRQVLWDELMHIERFIQHYTELSEKEPKPG